MLDDRDHFAVAGARRRQPAIIDVERVPVVGTVRLVLRPVEDDPLPARAQLADVIRQPEALDHAEDVLVRRAQLGVSVASCAYTPSPGSKNNIKPTRKVNLNERRITV